MTEMHDYARQYEERALFELERAAAAIPFDVAAQHHARALVFATLAIAAATEDHA